MVKASEVLADYIDRFGPLPLHFCSTAEDWARAEHEARMALEGKRGQLREDEFPPFPLEDYPSGMEA